jgi:hypothetical protein
MSAWRRKAIECLPEYRRIIDGCETPMSLWIELHLEFENAFTRNNQRLLGRILELASWSVSDAAGRPPSEISTAVACAFYEHLPQRREYWPFFRSWFSQKEFTDLIGVFSYHLSAGDIADLKKLYARAK